jgi:hypothetical protein
MIVNKKDSYEISLYVFRFLCHMVYFNIVEYLAQL